MLCIIIVAINVDYPCYLPAQTSSRRLFNLIHKHPHLLMRKQTLRTLLVPGHAERKVQSLEAALSCLSPRTCSSHDIMEGWGGGRWDTMRLVPQLDLRLVPSTVIPETTLANTINLGL